jgi:hypothetical protein
MKWNWDNNEEGEKQRKILCKIFWEGVDGQ